MISKYSNLQMDKNEIFDSYQRSFADSTEHFSVSEIVAVATGLHRVSRDFQYHNNWEQFLFVSTVWRTCF